MTTTANSTTTSTPSTFSTLNTIQGCDERAPGARVSNRAVVPRKFRQIRTRTVGKSCRAGAHRRSTTKIPLDHERLAERPNSTLRVHNTEAGADVHVRVRDEWQADYEVFSVGRSDTQWIPLACLAVCWGRSSSAHSGQVTELRTTVCLYSVFTVPCTHRLTCIYPNCFAYFGSSAVIFFTLDRL